MGDPMRRCARTFILVRIYLPPTISFLILLIGIQFVKASENDELLCRGKLRLSQEPFLGETVQVVLTVTALESLNDVKLVWGLRHVGIEVVDCGKEVYFCMGKGETEEFTANLHFVSSPVGFTVRLFRTWFDERRGVEQRGPTIGGAGFSLVLVDEETGRFGGEAELRAKKPEYQYDPMTGKMTNDIGSPQARYNRKRMDDLKERGPTLTDWEALYILHDLEVLFGRYGLSGEKAIEVALDAGRLIREQGMDRNEALEKVVRRREAWRFWRFGIIMLVVAVEVLLLLFITQKVPVRRRNETAFGKRDSVVQG
jgi:hypothetical protein